MMEASFPIYMMLALAVGAGLLAVFVVWVGKQIANEQTRSQGIATAGIALGVLLFGFFIVPTRTVVHLAPPTAVPVTVTESSASIEQNGSMEVHVHSGHPAASPPSATVASGPVVGQAQFAWGPVAMAVIVVGIIAIIVSSKRGLAAALACLGIVGAVLVMYLFAARSSHQVAPVAEVTPRAVSSSDWHTSNDHHVAAESIPVSDSVSGIAAADAAREEIKAEADTASDKKGDGKSASVEKKAVESSASEDHKATPKSSPPAWIDSEPTMEQGVYRAAVVSGPYSTKRECETQLDEPLRKAMMEYADDHLPPDVRFHAWGNTAFIRNNLIEERYFSEDQYEHVVRPMYNLHVRLKVDADDVARFNALAHDWRVRQAVEETSIGGLFVLGSLVVAYGALRYMGCKKRGAACDPGIPSSEATL